MRAVTKYVALVALILTALGCVQTGAVTCPDDRTCPTDTLCHPTLPLCVSHAAELGCQGKADGDPCVAGADRGICETGFCIPGCGDGEADDREECDDGNFRSHDGCSSSCLLEQRSWIEWHPDWIGRSHHMLAYHEERKELLMFGGGDDVEAFTDHWTRHADLTWTRSASPLGIRTQAMVAYDSKRKKLVLFGGSGISGSMSGDLGDTWEYDGTWTQVFPTVSPPARRGGQITYDAVRERIVLFSGRMGGGTHPSDLWEYDGTTWTQITATSSTGTLPGGRVFAAFAWDATRNTIVMFSGQSIGTYNDLWEYSNAIWTSIPRVANAPPVQRYGAAFAYSPARSKLVLYGGIVNNANVAADTWEYDGTWTASVSPVIPPARASASFTYDTDRNALVLVGGLSATGPRHVDVWEYTSTGTWVDNSRRLFPSARQVRATYDAARGQVVMFGGYGKSGAILNDTWIFDGTSWTEPALSAAPPLSRYNQQLTYDAARDRVVMFGGARSSSLLTDTLEWNGTSWATIPPTVPPSGPAARANAAMADTAGPGVMMFSGLVLPGGASSYQEAWEFDGATWTQSTPPAELSATYGAAAAYDAVNERTIVVATDGTTWAYANHAWTPITADGPSARVHAAMVYDPWLERVVLYGGSSPSSLEDYADLWELVGDVWHQVPLFGAQPAVRSRPGFSALPAQRSLLLFGGIGLEDTWYLRYISATANEICDNGVDDDTDRQIDDADPDCP